MQPWVYRLLPPQTQQASAGMCLFVTSCAAQTRPCLSWVLICNLRPHKLASGSPPRAQQRWPLVKGISNPLTAQGISEHLMEGRKERCTMNLPLQSQGRGPASCTDMVTQHEHGIGEPRLLPNLQPAHRQAICVRGFGQPLGSCPHVHAERSNGTICDHVCDPGKPAHWLDLTDKSSTKGAT